MEQAIQDLAADLSNIIALYGPAVVSVISMIASIFVAITKFKASAQNSIGEIKKTASEIRQSNTDVAELKMQCSALIKQNAELQSQLSTTLTEMNTNIECLKDEVSNVKKL